MVNSKHRGGQETLQHLSHITNKIQFFPVSGSQLVLLNNLVSTVNLIKLYLTTVPL